MRGAVRDEHLQAHLDEFAFCHNNNGVGRMAARVIEQLAARELLPRHKAGQRDEAANGSAQLRRKRPEGSG